MDGSRKSILDLNDYCKLEILKYVIADCESRDKSHGNQLKYLDLVSFALVHEDLEDVLEQYYNDLYFDLEFLFLANKESLEIDFAELQSTYTGKVGDVYWRFLADAIRENSRVMKVILLFKPESFQPDFLDHFQMIKCALENKKNLKKVEIRLNGYSLDDLNNFGHIKKLSLDVRMSAEALVSVCKSNPELLELKFMSSDIFGRLSDIVPHCRSLSDLEFVAKPDVDGAEYAPLAQLPNLKEMTIHGAFKDGSLLTMFEAIQQWQRPETQQLKITFTDELPLLSSITLPGKNLLRSLETSTGNSDTSVRVKSSYNFLELTTDIDRVEESLATFILIEGVNLYVVHGIRHLIQNSYKASNANVVASQIKVFNVDDLELVSAEEYSQAHLSQLFGLLQPKGLRTNDIGGQVFETVALRASRALFITKTIVSE